MPGPDTRHTARWLFGLVLWQFATGLSNVVLGWPLLAAVGHTGGAAALVMVLVGAGLAQPGSQSSAQSSVLSFVSSSGKQA